MERSSLPQSPSSLDVHHLAAAEDVSERVPSPIPISVQQHDPLTPNHSNACGGRESDQGGQVTSLRLSVKKARPHSEFLSGNFDVQQPRNTVVRRSKFERKK